jgi:predicted DNA-binding transcriptional regulator AlpA
MAGLTDDSHTRRRTSARCAPPYVPPLRHTLARRAHLFGMSASPDPGKGLPVLLTIHDIAALLRVRRTAAYAHTRDPDFPDPLIISGSCYRWYRHEVVAFLDTRRTAKKQYLRRSPAPAGRSVTQVEAPSSVPRARQARRPRRSGSAPKHAG